MLDIFKDDAFSEIALTDAINKIPFIPGQASAVVPWQPSGVSKLTIAIEQKEGALAIVNPSPRGGPGTTFDKDKRTIRDLRVPHYQIDDAVYADELQGVRAYGQETGVQSVSEFVNSRMQDHGTLRMDVTMEHQRLGALKGIIVDGSGNTVYNLFTEFAVAQPTERDFALDNAAANGHVRKECAAITRVIAEHMGGIPWSGVGALCSPEFFDALIAEEEVRVTYLNQQEAAQLRGGYAYGRLSYGGILFEEYRGSVGGSALITANKAHFFPLSAPGLYRTYYAPADYVDTVNTIGLPRYARQREMPNGKGIELEMQSNALSIVTRPGVLVQGKTT
jgi:hypothetical protein